MTPKRTKPYPKRSLRRSKKLTSPVSVVISDEQDRAYQRVMEITALDFDARKIALALASRDPIMFVRLYEETTVVLPWMREVITAIYQANDVHAINKIRGLGFCLMDSKCIVDNLRWYMSKSGYMLSASEPKSLSSDLEPIFQELKTAAHNML